jgi:NAD(P)-dependent dehydrogenase (short-subunit alcohol dehydrogenase family)
MELRDSTALILGGSGLVGRAVARRLLDFAPKRVIVTGLYRHETEDAVRDLEPHARGAEIAALWGNIFHPVSLAERAREDVLADPSARRELVDDLLGGANVASLEKNLLHHWLTANRPDLVVDCVNTATAVAYQDGFASAQRLLAAADKGTVDRETVERHLLTLSLPQLVRHLEALSDGMRRGGTRAYVKIGTSGTGGMGLNIPYTHSEEKPSRTLMSKSAVAGAQSMLLFLQGRTPGAPATIEIKPTAAIGWSEISYGPVSRGGRVLELVDCERPLSIEQAFTPGAGGWTRTGAPLESAYIAMGENGIFARDEFETVSALGQMEIVTAEELAEAVIMEVRGEPTGKDIIAALDASTFGPTYRGGYLRAVAVQGLEALEKEHGVRSIAFEMLGPPRLTKLLYEAHILSKLFPTVRDLAAADPASAAAKAERLVREQEPALRKVILSVGIPILLSDGLSVLRGEVVVVPPDGRGADIAPRGWVDLRPSNIAQWVKRAALIAAEPRPAGTGSAQALNWIGADERIVPSRVAVWIFEHEDGGYRIKR